MPPHEQQSAILEPAVTPSMLRAINQRLLLDLLFSTGPATRPKLALNSGLSQPTVFAALEDLERARLVREVPDAPKSAGRPAAVYEADPTAGTVVGVDIGRSWIHVVVSDLVGRTLVKTDAVNDSRDAAALVDLVSRTVDTAIAQSAIDPVDVTHTVIGSPGVLDVEQGRVRYAANLPGWHRSGLSQALTERLGASLTIDNDVNLAALAEHTHGALTGVRDAVYLHIGTGIGLGMILNGKLYRGHSGAAGEVGFMPLGDPLHPSHADEPMRGMLEESLAADAVVSYGRRAGMAGELTARAIFDAARLGDKRALAAVAMEGSVLAKLIASISAFLDPELIVFGGGVGLNLDLLEPPMRSALLELSPLSPKLAVGALGGEAVVRGAVERGIMIAREIIFSSRMSGAAPQPIGT